METLKKVRLKQIKLVQTIWNVVDVVIKVKSCDYELDLKLKQITELFSDIYDGEIQIFESPLKSAYRNKMEYTFADMYKDSPIMLGMHKKNRFYEVVDTKECNLA